LNSRSNVILSHKKFTWADFFGGYKYPYTPVDTPLELTRVAGYTKMAKGIDTHCWQQRILATLTALMNLLSNIIFSRFLLVSKINDSHPVVLVLTTFL